jgi:hypothetical protein
MQLVLEPGRVGYIGFYSGRLRTTLGSTVAKERRGLAAGSYDGDPMGLDDSLSGIQYSSYPKDYTNSLTVTPRICTLSNQDQGLKKEL